MSLLRPEVHRTESLDFARSPSLPWVGGWLRPVAVACAILVISFPAIGSGSQTSEKLRLGSLRGTLSTTQENASAGLAGITVNLTLDPADGSPLSADTDDAGHYEFTQLKPGNYKISISQPGFKPFTKSISLNPGQAATVDIRVELLTV